MPRPLYEAFPKMTHPETDPGPILLLRCQAACSHFQGSQADIAVLDEPPLYDTEGNNLSRHHGDGSSPKDFGTIGSDPLCHDRAFLADSGFRLLFGPVRVLSGDVRRSR